MRRITIFLYSFIQNLYEQILSHINYANFDLFGSLVGLCHNDSYCFVPLCVGTFQFSGFRSQHSLPSLTSIHHEENYPRICYSCWIALPFYKSVRLVVYQNRINGALKSWYVLVGFGHRLAILMWLSDCDSRRECYVYVPYDLYVKQWSEVYFEAQLLNLFCTLFLLVLAAIWSKIPLAATESKRNKVF